MKEVRIIQENDKSFQLVPFIDLTSLERAIIEISAKDRPPFPIDNMIFNPERYSGMLIKFSTPKIITENYKMDKFIEMARLYYHKNATRSRVVKPSYHDSDDKMTRISKMIQMKWFENSKGSKKYRKKLTTVKLFRSGKINIDHVNNMNQAKLIREYVVKMIMMSWDTVIYYEN
jgi:TATA-box binding protein (TBP) (component of TFIID and TFIIIB)